MTGSLYVMPGSIHVMAGLVPAIHALASARKAWMPGMKPGMTTDGVVENNP
jgi:hypothetical protein